MSTPKVLVAIIALSFPFFCCAQKNSKSYEFNKITVADFEAKYTDVDLGNGAVVIADVGETSFKGNLKGWFSLIYKHKTRIKIVDKKAFDIATINIPLYKSTTSNDEERVESLKASTFNLVNGTVEEVKLEKSGVFDELVDKNHLLKKFTLPAVKEGSIIEYSYTINSDFLFNLQPWSFQGGYPRLWSEYKLNLPEYFKYAVLSQGYQPFAIQDQQKVYQSFRINVNTSAVGASEIVVLNSENQLSRWVMTNVPGLNEEPFTSNLGNYISKIQFQLSGQQFPNQDYREILGNWPKLASTLMKDAGFMGDFSKANNWVNDILKSLTLDNKDATAKAKIIFNHVQENYTNLGRRGIFMTSPLKEVAKLRQGYAQEINLLLALLLKEAKLDASPTLVSTRDHSFVSEFYPLVEQYNYVVVKFRTSENAVFLDAASKSTAFGKLPVFCYRNQGVSIQENPEKENLLAESVSEDKTTRVQLFASNPGKNMWEGVVTSVSGDFEAASIRNSIALKSDFLEQKIKESFDDNFIADSVIVEKLKQKDQPLTIKYNLTITNENEPSIIYFNPIFKEGREQFTLKAATRTYPVELPHKYQQSYFFSIEAPKGYVIDEVPKSARVKFNEDEGLFEYLVQKSENQVSLRMTLNLSKTVFMPEEYENLQQFFNYISKKYAEQIVFKKSL